MRALQIDFSLYVVFTAFDPDKICHLRKNGLYSKVDLIDDVGLFNAALSVDDINSIMKEGLGKTFGLTPVELNGQLSATWGAIKGRF